MDSILHARVVKVASSCAGLAALLACSESSPTAATELPEISLSTPTAAFSAPHGGPAPQAIPVGIANAGDGTLEGLTATIAYGAGQPSGWLDASLSGTSAPSTLTLTASTTTTDAGRFDATVTVAATDASPRTVSVTLDLDVGAAPTIVVTSPARAAMLEQGSYEMSDVRITGEACHESVPMASLEVNGVSLPVSGNDLCVPFDVTQASPWGMSTITVRASNAFGRRAELVQAYLRSPDFAEASLPPAAVASAIRVQLNQAALDDGNTNTLDDVKSILSAQLRTIDFDALLPQLLATTDVLQTNDWWNPCTDELEFFKRFVSIGEIQVFLSAEPTGMRLSVYVSDLSMGVGARYTGCLGGVTTAEGTFSADGAAYVGTAAATGAGNGIQVALLNGQVETLGGELTIDTSGFIAEVAQFILNYLQPAIIDELEEVVVDVVDSEMPSALESIFDGLAIDQSVDVNSRELAVVAAIDGVQHGTDYVQFGVRAQVAPGASPVGPEAAYGPILRSALEAAPVFSATAYEGAAAVSIDLLNQMLWSAWRAGAFEVPDLDGAVVGGVEGLDGSLSALLPPVIVRGEGGTTFDLAWGDLAVAAIVDRTMFGLPGAGTGPAIDIAAYGSARVGVEIGYDEEAYRFVVTSITPDVSIQVNGADAPVDETAVATRIEGVLEGVLATLIPDALSAIPQPAFDISGLTGVEGAALRLTGVTVGHAGAYLTLTGSVGN